VKHRTVLIAVTLFCLIPSLTATAQQQKQSPPSIESHWLAKILKVTRPDSVTIRKPKELEIPPPDERNESPSEDQQWLVLGVELKAPPKSIIETQEINLVDEESAMYPALARDCEENTFVLFAEMPLGLAIGTPNRKDPGDVILYLEPDTNKTRLAMESGSSSEVSFLFSIPVATKSLHLQIGKGAQVLVPSQ
jgi:hypothetical protein